MRMIKFATYYAFLSFTISSTSLQAQTSENSFVSADEAQANLEMCELNNSLSSAPPMQTIVRVTGNAQKAVNANLVFQCFDLFAMIRDYAPSDQAKTIGKQLWQTGTKFHLTDLFATNLSVQQAAFSGTYGFMNSEQTIGYYWMKRRIQESVHDELVSLIEGKDASKIVNTTALCFTVASNLQEHFDSLKESGELVATARSFQETQNISEKQADIFGLVNEAFFGFPTPSGEQVSGNFEVGTKLAPLVFAAGLAWQNAGFPRLDSHAEKRWQLVDKGLDQFCKP